VRPDEIRRLLGGYATGTLTDDERTLLFSAALEDQSLFDALADEEALREFVRARLAGYKTPKRIITIDNIGRASNGKADYKGATAYAKQRLGIAG